MGTTNFDAVQLGSGSTLQQIAVYTPSLTPVAVAANTVAEQTFTVTGLTTADRVIVNHPAITAGVGPISARVSAANTLAVAFANNAAGSLTPAAGVYAITAIRAS